MTGWELVRLLLVPGPDQAAALVPAAAAVTPAIVKALRPLPVSEEAVETALRAMVAF